MNEQRHEDVLRAMKDAIADAQRIFSPSKVGRTSPAKRLQEDARLRRLNNKEALPPATNRQE